MRRRTLGLLLIGTIGMAGQAVPALAAQKKTAGSAGGGAVTITASRQDQSPPLTSIAPAPDGKKRGHAARTRHGQFADIAETPQDIANPAPVGASTAPSTTTSWEGIHNINGVLPPDTNGDVGPNNYVQWVNLSYQVWNKTGTSIYGPVNGATLWSGFGGLCQTTNDGDPVVLYDKLANRWFLSQFAFNTDSGGNPVAPFHQCIAVSTTGDPTGSFYRYDYNLGSLMNDYPKFGVWPDAYYMSANLFNGNSFAGAGVFAYDRTAMLAGQPAAAIEFQLNTNYSGILPANFDGTLAPPAGEQEVFAGVDTAGAGTGSSLQVWHFLPNFATPSASTFGATGNAPDTALPVAAYNFNLCNYGSCVTQPGTSQRLDTLSDRLMNRLQYRRFSDHEALVVNHTVNVGNNLAGIRWYEVRNPSAPTLFQSGTYAPDAGTASATNRWMASVALDRAGNMAAGYSAASSSVYPSIRYTGRLASDTAGTLSLPETTVVAGGGSELAYGRWGDYSSMSVDPSDDCTFWYTQEYYAAPSNAGWQTRIANFKLPGCGTAATSTSLTSSPNPSFTGDTVTLTATVTASGSSPLTSSVSFADGTTTLGTVPVSGSTATYTVSSLAAGAHSLTATYQGDSANASSTSPVVTQTVNARPKTASTTALSSSLNPSDAGSAVTFTATVTVPSGSTTPNGTVSFADGSTILASAAPLSASGTAVFTTTGLAAGTHSVTATYSGDSTYATSTSPAVSQVVNAIATTTALTASPNPSTFTQAVTLTATVSPSASPVPGGTVTFKDGTSTLGTGTVSTSGQATLTTTALSVGPHSLTATYGGDSYHSASTSAPVSQTVNPAPGGVVNGGFETGSLTGWTPAGTNTVVSPGHSGSWTARVGGTSPTNGDSSLSQTFTVPAGTSALQLAYKVVCPDTVRYDWATVTLRDNTTGTTKTVLARTCTNTGAWQTLSTSVTAGHSVTLKLVSHDDNYPGDPTYALFDDVTVA